VYGEYIRTLTPHFQVVGINARNNIEVRKPVRFRNGALLSPLISDPDVNKYEIEKEI
jgi:hypothetical protein